MQSENKLRGCVFILLVCCNKETSYKLQHHFRPQIMETSLLKLG